MSLTYCLLNLAALTMSCNGSITLESIPQVSRQIADSNMLVMYLQSLCLAKRPCIEAIGLDIDHAAGK